MSSVISRGWKKSLRTFPSLGNAGASFRAVSIFFAAGLFAVSSPGGEVRGRVTAKGKDVPNEAGGGGKYESRKARFFERVDYGQLRDFVVWLETTNVLTFPKPTKPVQVVVQKDAMFHPHVLPILVGTDVEWPNQDDIFHNVFSFSDAREFDLGLYKDQVKKVAFDRPCRVDIFCSIHKNMGCVILVRENPWFAAAGADGRYSIGNVPAGHYRIKAWHERLPPQTREIDVAADGADTQDFVLGITGLPQL